MNKPLYHSATTEVLPQDTQSALQFMVAAAPALKGPDHPWQLHLLEHSHVLPNPACEGHASSDCKQHLLVRNHIALLKQGSMDSCTTRQSQPVDQDLACQRGCSDHLPSSSQGHLAREPAASAKVDGGSTVHTSPTTPLMTIAKVLRVLMSLMADPSAPHADCLLRAQLFGELKAAAARAALEGYSADQLTPAILLEHMSLAKVQQIQLAASRRQQKGSSSPCTKECSDTHGSADKGITSSSSRSLSSCSNSNGDSRGTQCPACGVAEWYVVQQKHIRQQQYRSLLRLLHRHQPLALKLRLLSAGTLMAAAMVTLLRSCSTDSPCSDLEDDASSAQ